MNKSQPTGPAQPNQVDQAETDRKQASAQPKQQQQQKPKDDDMPGADGFRSAGANEDTYD